MSRYPVLHTASKSIEEHLSLIQRQVKRSVRDPELRQLAVKLVSGSYVWKQDPRTGQEAPFVKAWSYYFQAPAREGCPTRDDECEVLRIWDFTVLNFRYVYDPDEVDTFATAKLSLEAGGGDCFPVGTLVLREDGRTVPIEMVGVGDRIHDGQRFVEVLKTWDRGPRDMIRASLNNGRDLFLSDRHKLLRVGSEGVEECRMGELSVRDNLLQPREFGGGNVELDDDDALLMAAYLAEGCKINKKKGGPRTEVSLAGVESGKGVREQVCEILDKRGVRYRKYERELRFAVKDVPVLQEDLGNVALDKHLPHLDWGPRTVAILVDTLERTDGGLSSSGKNMVYSTISPELALQYQILKRMQGISTHMKTLSKHGGAGRNPIHRLTARTGDVQRPWAQVRELVAEEPVHCVDIMTESGRVYLPQSDVIVRQCDDATILICSLLKAIGFSTAARVISVQEDPENWVHVYPLVGLPKDNPQEWIPLDITVTGYKPGDQYHDIGKLKDFPM